MGLIIGLSLSLIISLSLSLTIGLSLNLISLLLSMISYIKMETSSAVIIFIFLIGICYMIYDSIPSKYTKLEPSKYPPKLWWIYE